MNTPGQPFDAVKQDTRDRLSSPHSCQIRSADWSTERDILIRLRERVFVQEQGVPAELELDEHDPYCLHLLAIQEQEPVGTGRLLPDGHIGRLAVLPAYRKQGIGRALLDGLIQVAVQRELAKVSLNAQVQAIPFYEKAGFVVGSEEFLDAGIPHKGMHRFLTSPCDGVGKRSL